MHIMEQSRAEQRGNAIISSHSFAYTAFSTIVFLLLSFRNKISRKEKDNNNSGTADSDWFRIVATAASHEKPNPRRPIRRTFSVYKVYLPFFMGGVGACLVHWCPFGT